MTKALDHRIRVAAIRREEMQLHLLFTGLILAADTSIHELEVEDIIRHAAVSRGSFYNYFQSLPALYDSLARQLMRELEEMADGLISHSPNIAVRLGSRIRILMRLMVDFPILGRFVTQLQWPNQNPESELFKGIIRDIELGIKEEQFANMPPSIGVNIAIGSLIGGVHTMLSQRPATGFEDKVTNQVLLGLGLKADAAVIACATPLEAHTSLPKTGLLGRLSNLEPSSGLDQAGTRGHQCQK